MRVSLSLGEPEGTLGFLPIDNLNQGVYYSGCQVREAMKHSNSSLEGASGFLVVYPLKFFKNQVSERVRPRGTD